MDQTDMFSRIVERGTEPMAPNEHGLFTANQVAVLVDKRYCRIHAAGDYVIEIKYPVAGKWTHATITATDKGLWHPVKIFRACREAAGKPHYEVDVKVAKITNPRNLNEMLIAKILAADGVKPFLSRRMEHVSVITSRSLSSGKGPRTPFSRSTSAPSSRKASAR